MKRMMAVLLLLSLFCAATAMGEETVPSCEAWYAVLNGDDTLKIEAALVTCSPLDHYVAIAVRCAYRSLVNFEVTAFHVYFNDQPVETLLPLRETEFFETKDFYGVFALPEGGITQLRIVPVGTTAYAVETITEELPSCTLSLTDFSAIEGQGENVR